MSLAAEAPAKINRELRLGGRRPDGYQEIRSRVVSIDLADRITVEPGSGFLGRSLMAPHARCLATLLWL